MNGCLFKTLIVMTVIVALIAAFPYLRKYASDSMQEKFDKIENTTNILKKAVQYSYGRKSKENDDNKNKETGK